jgi:hypothetical protein
MLFATTPRPEDVHAAIAALQAVHRMLVPDSDTPGWLALAYGQLDSGYRIMGHALQVMLARLPQSEPASLDTPAESGGAEPESTLVRWPQRPQSRAVPRRVCHRR